MYVYGTLTEMVCRLFNFALLFLPCKGNMCGDNNKTNNNKKKEQEQNLRAVKTIQDKLHPWAILWWCFISIHQNAENKRKEFTLQILNLYSFVNHIFVFYIFVHFAILSRCFFPIYSSLCQKVATHL